MMPPWFALVCNKLPTGLGIWSQLGARSMTQLASSASGAPPLWTYTTKPRCPTHDGLLRIRSHASTTCKLRKATQSQLSTATCWVDGGGSPGVGWGGVGWGGVGMIVFMR